MARQWDRYVTAPPDEPAQHALADAGLNGSDISLAERGQLADAQRPVVEEKHGIDDAAVIVDVLVERIAEPILQEKATRKSRPQSAQ